MNKSIVVNSMIGLSLRKELLRGPAKVVLTTSHLNLKVNVDLFRFDVILFLYWLLICNVKGDNGYLIAI